MRILLLEDDPELASAIQASLGRHGMVVDVVGSMARAAEALKPALHQILLLDRQLLVLEALAVRQGRTVARAALLEAVYGFDDAIQSNALDAHVSKLRKALAEANARVEIHVMRGIGYLLKDVA